MCCEHIQHRAFWVSFVTCMTSGRFFFSKKSIFNCIPLSQQYSEKTALGQKKSAGEVVEGIYDNKQRKKRKLGGKLKQNSDSGDCYCYSSGRTEQNRKKLVNPSSRTMVSKGLARHRRRGRGIRKNTATCQGPLFLESKEA